MSKIKIGRRALTFIMAWSILALPGWSLAAEGDGELGVQVGVLLPDEDLAGQSRSLGDVEVAYGLRGGYHFSPDWAWFADIYRSAVDTRLQPGSAATWALRSGLEYYLSPEDRRRRWFLAGGPGWLEVDLDGGAGFDRTFASLGFGQRWQTGSDNALRWELRADRSLSDDGLGGAGLTRGLFMLSYAWGLGGGADSDGDGVRDRRDDCPSTPRGATVNRRGCPADADGDGVFDGLDACPATAPGWPVDDRGCPRDSDGDGVSDGEDECPKTPQGASVDDRGCPRDSDGDGVFDGLDACPETSRGASVDDRGCPRDADGDGVFDGLDRCPDTPRAWSVDRHGCPKDSDADGVPDGKDACPETPAGTAVGDNGCKKAEALFEGKNRILVLEGVNFDTNSAELSAESRAVLDGVARALRDWPEVRVEIAGHTDADGAKDYNQKLSQRRAEAVRAYLISKGIAGERLTARGYGESRPIADNATSEAKARNRRVELERIDGDRR
ncbi:MAG TPA: OmpA family protein [Acidobacteria bacterium]|nr:OmpA family protein [Acidobacteriota bacterium]